MDFLPIPLLRILSKRNWCLVIWFNDSKKLQNKRKEKNNMVKNNKKMPCCEDKNSKGSSK